jgi:hypothetical protein
MCCCRGEGDAVTNDIIRADHRVNGDQIIIPVWDAATLLTCRSTADYAA